MLDRKCNMKRLGLLGGISWVSTVEYYRRINEGINARCGGLHFADCLIHSIDFGALQDVGWDQAQDMLLESCHRLEAAGAEAIVLCANTAHLHDKTIQADSSLPLIHIVDATVSAVRAHGLRKVGVLGTQFVMESDLYSKGFQNADIEVLIPDRKGSRQRIQQTLKEELGRGIVRAETKSFYLSEMAALQKRGVEGIVLACTELPLIIQPLDAAIPLFDTLEIHTNAAVQFALGEVTQDIGVSQGAAHFNRRNNGSHSAD